MCTIYMNMCKVSLCCVWISSVNHQTHLNNLKALMNEACHKENHIWHLQVTFGWFASKFNVGCLSWHIWAQKPMSSDVWPIWILYVLFGILVSFLKNVYHIWAVNREWVGPYSSCWMNKTIVDVNIFIIDTASCGPWSYKKRPASRRHYADRAVKPIVEDNWNSNMQSLSHFCMPSFGHKCRKERDIAFFAQFKSDVCVSDTITA